MGKNVFDDIFDNEFFKQWKQTHPDVLAGIGRSMSPLEELLVN